MRRWALLAGIMMLAVLLLPAATAQWEDTDGYYIAITYGAGEYEVGDDVDVTVHVFENAAYVDVDNVTFSVGSFTTLRDVDVTRSATGKWQGTFTIGEDDVTEFFGMRFVGLSATAEVNGTDEEDGYTSIYLKAEDTEDASVLAITNGLDPPSVYMDPGERKTITWEFRYKDQLVDPTSINLKLNEGDSSSDISPVKGSVGKYTYEYTMPNEPMSIDVKFEMYAKYEVGNKTVEGESGVDLYLVYFHVWAKKGAASATSASFDLYVSNGTGRSVEAASITLDYFYSDDADDPQKKSTNGTTDADGRATIQFAYNDLGDDEYEVYVTGKVTAQGKVQDLEFDMMVRAEPTDEPEPPVGFDLDVIPQKDTIGFDKEVNLPATAYFDGEPKGSATMYWYAHTPHAVLNKGTTTTKVDGTFSIDFKTPKKGSQDPLFLTAHFETPIEDGTTEYYDDDEMMSITSRDDMDFPDNSFDILDMFHDNAVKVSVAKLEKGKDVPVTITYNKADREWMCYVVIGNEANPSNMGRIPTWTYWTVSVMDGLYGDICSYEGGKFQGSIFVPDNLPNKNYFVAGMLINQNKLMTSIFTGDYEQWIKTNYIKLEVGQSGTTDDNGDSIMDYLMDTLILGLPLLYWIFILIIIVVLGVVVGKLSTRRKRTKDVGAPGLEPAEGPSFGGDLGPAQMPMPAHSYDQMQPVAGQAEYTVPAAAPPPAQPEYAAPPPAQPEYAVPPPPQPEYAAPPPAQPEYAVPPPAQPEYAVPPPAQPEYAAPPPPQPEYAAPMAPAMPEPVVPPVVPPVAPPPEATPPVPEAAVPPVQPPAAAPPPVSAAPPPAVAPAPAPAPAAEVGATMTIRCQKCQTTLTIPRKRPIKVTCPNCGASGVLR